MDGTLQHNHYEVESPSQDACLPWLKKNEFGVYESLTDTSKMDNEIFKPSVSDRMFSDMLNDSRDVTEISIKIRRKLKKASKREKNSK